MTDATTKSLLRRRVMSRDGLLVSGAFNALSARIIEDEGYEAIYITGAGLTNMQFGWPDLGFIGLSDVIQCTGRIREAVGVPLVVDADTGFGNAVNVYQTVRSLERVGADAIQLEDQAFPKRCGHFEGKQLASKSEMLGKIHAACDARSDNDLMIIARTDARSSLGLEAAIERAQQYAEAGADVLFIEAPQSTNEVRRLPQVIDAPLLINMVIGGKTPAINTAELRELRYGMILYPNAALQGAVSGMKNALRTLKLAGLLKEDPASVVPYAERQRLVNKPFYDDLEHRYSKWKDAN